MGLRDSITAMATGTYTVTREPAGTYEAGRYVRLSAATPPIAPTTFDIVASIQPLRGRELADLPEGQRGDELRMIYTVTELRTRSASSESDVVTIDGEPWTVIRVERWQSFGAVHYQAYCSHAAP